VGALGLAQRLPEVCGSRSTLCVESFRPGLVGGWMIECPKVISGYTG
jgi:hypothetical protein